MQAKLGIFRVISAFCDMGVSTKCGNNMENSKLGMQCMKNPSAGSQDYDLENDGQVHP